MNDNQYIVIYLSFAFFSGFLLFSLNVIFVVYGKKAAKELHKKAFFRIMRSPISFFNTTPNGRIINRFNKDQDIIDNNLADSIKNCFIAFTSSITTIIMVLVKTAYFIIPIIPICFLYWLIQEIYRRTSLELKRLNSISRSDLYSHFVETISGISTIRVYNQQLRFIETTYTFINKTNSQYFLLTSSQRVLCVFVDFLGALMIFFTVICFVPLLVIFF